MDDSYTMESAPVVKSPRLTLSVHEASELSGFSEYAIRRGVRDGTIPAITSGRLIRVLRLPLLRILNADSGL